MSQFYSFSAELLEGQLQDFSAYKGKWVLVVNTASRCGFTPQYDGLEKLYQQFKNQELVILGFPCNQFSNQEPGGVEQIAETCRINYGVTFPVFAKVDVNGENAHPVFIWLKKELPGFLGNSIKWNFTKFLIAPDGKPVKRFATITKPEKIAGFISKLL